MRITTFAFGLFSTCLATVAVAMPTSPIPNDAAIFQIQLQCSPSRCIDPRTGVYTQSTCDRYGCRQSSGPVGRIGGRGQSYDDDDERGYDRRPRRRDRGDGYGRGSGGFDCNASRCIDGNGSVWESTCDRRGCRPLRPARGQRW